MTATEFEQADKIIALKKAEHLPLVEERYPGFVDKVEYWHIDDAIGVLPLIEDEVMTLVAEMFGGGKARADGSRKPSAGSAGQEANHRKVGRETAGRAARA